MEIWPMEFLRGRCGLARGGAGIPDLRDIRGACSGVAFFLSVPRGVWPAAGALFLHETLVLVKAQEKLQGAL